MTTRAGQPDDQPWRQIKDFFDLPAVSDLIRRLISLVDLLWANNLVSTGIEFDTFYLYLKEVLLDAASSYGVRPQSREGMFSLLT